MPVFYVSRRVGLTSRWHKPSELNKLVGKMLPGDLIEMGRGLYSHWAVFAGVQFYGNEQVPCVFHCGSDPRLNCGNIVCGCMSFQKRYHGIGAVALEPLKEVCGRSHARFNNKMDETFTPFRPDTIIDRAELKNVNPDTYDLLVNNCEHFAKWCRYGVKHSGQVKSKCFGLITYAGTYVPTVSMLYVAVNQLKQAPSNCRDGQCLEESTELVQMA